MVHRSRGFTLLEIMIAVAVLATVAAALIKNAALTVRQTGVIQDKAVAYWIAENQLAALRVGPRDPGAFRASGQDRSPVTMASEDWEVVTRFERTQNENVVRVEVSVYRDDNLDGAVATLTGFLGRY